MLFSNVLGIKEIELYGLSWDLIYFRHSHSGYLSLLKL